MASSALSSISTFAKCTSSFLLPIIVSNLGSKSLQGPHQLFQERKTKLRNNTDTYILFAFKIINVKLLNNGC